MSQDESDPRFYELRNDASCDQHRARKLILYDPSIIEARNSLGETALHYLAVENAVEAVEFLAGQGADVNCRNTFGDAAIMEAAQLGYVEMVDLLLRLGATVEGPALLREADPERREQFVAVLKAHSIAV